MSTIHANTAGGAKAIRRGPIIAALLIGAFVALLNQTLMNVALPKMMEDLNIVANTAQWLTTGFMLVNGVLIPIQCLPGREIYDPPAVYYVDDLIFHRYTDMCDRYRL